MKQQKNKYNRELLECAICEFRSVNLVSHLHFKHEMKAKAYKEKYGAEYKSPATDEMREVYKKASPRCVEYWLERGCTDDIARQKVREHQSKFSLETCIKKYGDDEGARIWRERQDKWIRTMSLKTNDEKDRINKSKGSSGAIASLKEKYKEGWKIEFIKRQGNISEELVKLLLCETREEMISLAAKIVPYRNVRNVLSSKSLRDVFDYRDEYDFEQVKRSVIKQYHFDVINRRQKYGKMIAYEGVVYRSHGEVELAMFLNENNIDFFYEKKYPNSRYLYDFYIKDVNLYVEYTGMLDERKREQDIHRVYSNRLASKKRFCLESGFHTLFSNDIDRIKKYINKIMEKE